MPAPATLLVFALAAGVLVAIPGPNHIYIVTRSIAQGRTVGLASALGVETGTLVHISAATVGLSALIASSAMAFDTLRYAGAVYLGYLGIRALLRDERLDVEGPAAERPSLRRAYLDGILVNVLNPKVALFFLAFLPQFVDQSRPASTQILRRSRAGSGAATNPQARPRSSSASADTAPGAAPAPRARRRPPRARAPCRPARGRGRR
jgi:threonine/homoserine/homoserine lactone efflux protein